MSYTFAPYQSTPPPPCSGGPRPGVQAFMAYMMDRFGWTSMGIYNCRPPSRHAAGAAWDQGVPVGPGGSARPELGMQAIDLVLKHGKRLGVTLAIYNRKKWGAAYPDGKYYGGRHPHNDHIHWDFTNAAAENLTYATLVAVLGPVTGDGTPDVQFRPVLRYGMTGQYVRELQDLLDIEVDGDFGPNTEAAVKAFQEAQGLTVDGIVGSATWAALLKQDESEDEDMRVIQWNGPKDDGKGGAIALLTSNGLEGIPTTELAIKLAKRHNPSGAVEVVTTGEWEYYSKLAPKVGNQPIKTINITGGRLEVG